MMKVNRSGLVFLTSGAVIAAALAFRAPGTEPAPAPSAPAPAAPVPAVGGGQVLVVYRSNHPDTNGDGVGDSEEIARYYALRRGVPKTNLLGIKVAGEGDLSPVSRQAHWTLDSFLDRVIKPVTRKLDEIGRESVLYIVVCQGMPCRVKVPERRNESADQLLGLPFKVAADRYPFRHPYQDLWSPRYRKPPFAALRETLAKGERDATPYVVTRLEGVGPAQVKASIDAAIYAGRYVVDGWAYVDSRYGEYKADALQSFRNSPDYYSYETIDKGVALTGVFFREAGVPLRWENTDPVIGEKKTLKYTDGTSAGAAPRALAYAGWYNYARYLPVWDWLPGSVALDFDSASLYAPFEPVQSFGGAALFRGATAAVGVFEEPGAGGHPRPDVLFAYLVKGYTFGDAAWLSMPAKPLFAYAIGDPLMQPFAKARDRDAAIEPPDVTAKRKGSSVEVTVTAKGDFEVIRARAVAAAAKDDALLPPCGRQDGWFARERALTVALPAGGAKWLGVVATDPAGNTVRVWREMP
jgi:uncharacterized protein (TIGR03790 family)